MSLPAARRRRRVVKSVPSGGSPFDGTFGELRSILGDEFMDNNGVLLLLFETPSGFAIFSVYGFHLYKPDAIQSLWVDLIPYRRARDLREMIMKWRRPGQTLVVGKQEYKSIIESRLGIPCLHDEVVMELMWGMQRLMHKFVPREKSELANEDRVPMSQGLLMLLSRHGFHVSPEMVNEQIVMAAFALFNYDATEKEEYPPLQYIGRDLNRVSGINCGNWGALKLATAFKIICTHDISGSDEIFSKDVQLKLLEDADDYKDLIDKAACIKTYRALVSAHQDWAKNKATLPPSLRKMKRFMKALPEVQEN